MSDLWGPAMFLTTLGLIFTGYPVAFVLGGSALMFALIGHFVGVFDLFFLFAMPERTFGTMSNYTLLAVPFSGASAAASPWAWWWWARSLRRPRVWWVPA